MKELTPEQQAKASEIDAALDLIIVKSIISQDLDKGFAESTVTISLPAFLVEEVGNFLPNSNIIDNNKVLSLLVSKLCASGYSYEVKKIMDDPDTVLSTLNTKINGVKLDPKTT